VTPLCSAQATRNHLSKASLNLIFQIRLLKEVMQGINKNSNSNFLTSHASQWLSLIPRVVGEHV
jgi:hypothetical protein